MIIFLMAFFFIEETNEIFDTLSPMEIEQIGELPEGDRRYLLNRIKNGTFPTWSDLRNLNKGEMLIGEKEQAIRIDQIIDGSNFIGFGFGQSVWVDGVNTSNLSDDEILNIEGFLFFCDGNKQYTTVLGGSKTVMKLTIVSPEGSLELLRKIAEPRGFHVWGEGSKNLVIAKYLRSSSKDVTLQPLEGKRKTIKRASLTAVDEQWVSKQETAKKLEKEEAKKQKN